MPVAANTFDTEAQTQNSLKGNRKKDARLEQAEIEDETVTFRDVASENALLVIASGRTNSIKKDPRSVFALQRTIGNRKVERLLFPETEQSPRHKNFQEREENSKDLKTRSKKSEMASIYDGAKSNGRYLDSNIRNEMEPRFGYPDFSRVMIHTDSSAAKNAQRLQAEAYTVGNDIYFAQRKYNPSTTEGKKLLTHELTHVVQQQNSTTSGEIPQLKTERGTKGGRATTTTTTLSSFPESGRNLSQTEKEANEMEKKVALSERPKPKGKAGGEVLVAPGVADLLGKSNFNQIANFAEIEEIAALQGKKKQPIIVKTRFGNIADGQITVSRMKKEGSYEGKGALSNLRHPLLPSALGGEGGMLELDVDIKDNKIGGNISFPKGKALSNLIRKKDLEILRLLGLQGLDLSNLNPPENKIDEGGNLLFGITKFNFSVGKIFSGRDGEIIARNDKIETFSIKGQVNVKGLDEGIFELKRDEKGATTANAKLSVVLMKGKFSGNLTAYYNDGMITGEGKIDYKSDKFTGQVVLKLMDEKDAAKIKETKQLPVALPSESNAQPEKRKDKLGYAVAGEGTLNFAFTDWLNGTAKVIVDPEGYVTVIGKITPQKEVKLFEPPRSQYEKKFPKLEARAMYGIPYVADIFIAAGLQLTLWSVMEGKLTEIEIEGEYSTNPETRKAFQAQAYLKISAAAGITLNAYARGGLELLDHEISFGVGVNGTVGIKGYVNARPVIGYREEGEGNEDKKGVYFIRGEMEMAAMPFLSLSGEIFIELDSPWWSPAPDKRWPWPLGKKEWPLGGSFGVKGSVEHVLGSGIPPSIEFQEVEFSPDKFMNDLIEERTNPSSHDIIEKTGEWKEKNKDAAEVPGAVVKKKPGVEVGVAPEKPPAIPPSLPPKKAIKEKKGAPRDALALVPKGETPVEQEESRKKLEETKKRVAKEAKGKGPQKEEQKEEQEKIDKEKTEIREKDKDARWQKGVKVINQVLVYKQETGIGWDELNAILKSIKKQEFGFAKLYAKDEGVEYGIYASMSPDERIGEVSKKEGEKRGELVKEGDVSNKEGEVIGKYELAYAGEKEVSGSLKKKRRMLVKVTLSKFKPKKKTEKSKSDEEKLDKNLKSFKKEFEKLEEERQLQILQEQAKEIFQTEQVRWDITELKETKGEPKYYMSGRFAHKYAYQIIPNLPEGLEPERPIRGAHPLRADLVDNKNRLVYEIKPEIHNDEMAMRQLERYVLWLNEEYRDRPGPRWSIPQHAIYTYNAQQAMRWLVIDIMNENEDIQQSEAYHKAVEILRGFGFPEQSLYMEL